MFIFSSNYAVAQQMSASDIQSIYGEWAMYEDCGPGDNTSASTQESGPVYILGDSITAAAQEDIKTELGKVDVSVSKINGDVGRAISRDTVGSDPSGLDAVDEDASAIKESSTVVVALGTNSSGGVENLDTQIPKLINKIRGHKEDVMIFWVNIFSKGGVNRAALNEAIQNNAGANNYEVIDTVGANIELAGDNVHPTTAGNKTFAKTIAKSFSGTGGSTDTPMGGRTGVEFTTGMTVNTDGVGPSHGNPYHQSQTSYANGRLNADETNYLALAQGYAREKNLKLGDVAVVQYRGKTAYAIYGDNWRNVNEVHGEGSYRLVKELGMSFNGTSGGADSGVKYIIYPDTAELLDGSIDQDKIDEVGRQVSGGPAATSESSTKVPAGCVCPSGGAPSDGDSSGSPGGTTPGLSDEQGAFVDQYHDIAERLSIKYGIPWETVVAQGIEESAAGTSNFARERNNFFGIGAFTNNPDNAFRYPTPEEGWEGYYENIVETSSYRNNGVFKGDAITDPYAYARAIKKAGYADNPQYVANLSKLIAAVEKRAQAKGWKSSAQLAQDHPEMLTNAARNAGGGSSSSSDGGSGSSGEVSEVSCGGDGGSIEEGGLTEEQAKKLMMNYGENKGGDSANITGALWPFCGGGGSNCVTFAYFFNKKFTDMPVTPGDGNGNQIVSTLGGRGVETGNKPKVFSTFSWPNSGAGHVGIVLGIQGDNVIVGHASCSWSGIGKGDGTQDGGGAGFIKIGKIDDPSVWLGVVPTEFAYPAKIKTGDIESYIGG